MIHALRVSSRLVGWFEVMAIMPLHVRYGVRSGAMAFEFLFEKREDRDAAITAATKAFLGQMHCFELDVPQDDAPVPNPDRA